MEKKKVLTILLGLILLLSVITVTYAFFVSGVNNTNQQTATVTSGTMELTFEDNDNGIGAVLNFGDTITKKFTIENTGTLTAYAQISWLNIVNTYLEGSLIYSLEYSTSENGTYTSIITDKNVPRSTTASTIELASGIVVPANTKLYYSLHITLVNSETVDQTADLTASFITQFTLKNSSQPSVVDTIIASASTETVDLNYASPNVEITSLTKYIGYTNFYNDDSCTFSYDETTGIYTGYCGEYYDTIDAEVSFNIIETKELSLCYEVKAFTAFDSIEIYVNNNLTKEDFGDVNNCVYLGTLNTSSNIKIKIMRDYWNWGYTGNEHVSFYLTENYTKTDDSGIYTMEDDYGTSYYFRGAVENNYVKFAGYYWRIIRVNGDGSLRIIYDGTSAHENGSITTDSFATFSDYNPAYDDNAYVGYTYGGINLTNYTDTHHINNFSSTIKQAIDKWYENNIKDTKYESALADNIFCVDRTLSTGLGYGTEGTSYGSGISLTCPQKLDAYTVNDTTNGNGFLTYPIGLITYSEVRLAGGMDSSNNVSYYLYNGNNYWTMSPGEFTYSSDSGDAAMIYYVGPYSCLDNNPTNLFYCPASSYGSDYGVRPVINLSAEYTSTMTGTGSTTDPYTAE